MHKGIFALLLLLMLLGITGCGSKSIVSIELECQRLERVEKCSNYSSSNEQIMKKFERAIDTATKLPGALDYAAEYRMTITYSDHTIAKYDLSLGAERGKKGLLVDLNHSEVGYEIGKTYANQLREIINKSGKSE